MDIVSEATLTGYAALHHVFADLFLRPLPIPIRTLLFILGPFDILLDAHSKWYGAGSYAEGVRLGMRELV